MLFRFLGRQFTAVLIVLFVVNLYSGNAGWRRPLRFFYCSHLKARMVATAMMGRYYAFNFWRLPGREELEDIAANAAAKHGIDPYLAMGLIEVESTFRIHALSHRGACGLMQLLPSTARELGVDNPFDPHRNIDGGVRYLKKLITTFRGDLWAALVSYNWGPARVRKIRGAYSPAMEQYLKKILRARFKYDAKYRKNEYSTSNFQRSTSNYTGARPEM